MTRVCIESANFRFGARLEEQLAPKTCAVFRKMMPYRQKIIHVRWSGEGCWIPLGDLHPGIPVENATNTPAPGQMLFYPGGISETEIILAYGQVRFASKFGLHEGNHFLTITEGLESLLELGRRVLWDGAQDILFEAG
jgi:hypothetical protein